MNSQFIPAINVSDVQHPRLDEAYTYLRGSRPRSPHLHLWPRNGEHRLLVVQGSQLFDVPTALAQTLNAALTEGREKQTLERLGIDLNPMINDAPPEAMPVHAFSLAVAQTCNLSCSYCYAQQGEFGGTAKSMSPEQARKAVDRLIEQTPPEGRFNLAFMGGEPLINRAVLRDTTEYADQQARMRGLTPTFSITTNGTLLTSEDADFFERYGFAVTVSLDGVGDTHDALRPQRGRTQSKTGQGTYARILRNLQPLFERQRAMQVTARVTVTPQNLGLRQMLDTFLEAGFYSVGFSPMLHAPGPAEQMNSEHLALMLAEMIDCGREFERRTRLGQRYGFANLQNALKEIGKGTHRPYPCGAGAGYLGVSAEGGLYACHRFVGDEVGALGTLDSGIDLVKQHDWLLSRHVHQQTDCQQCWAKYLCGGGCHHEVLGAGRAACDYVRGWLQFSMEAFTSLSAFNATPESPCNND